MFDSEAIVVAILLPSVDSGFNGIEVFIESTLSVLQAL
jgi:hypothetical protein